MCTWALFHSFGQELQSRRCEATQCQEYTRRSELKLRPFRARGRPHLQRLDRGRIRVVLQLGIQRYDASCIILLALPHETSTRSIDTVGLVPLPEESLPLYFGLPLLFFALAVCSKPLHSVRLHSQPQSTCAFRSSSSSALAPS